MSLPHPESPPAQPSLYGLVSRAGLRRLSSAFPDSRLANCIALYTTLTVYAAEQGRAVDTGRSCIVAVQTLTLDLWCSVRTVQRYLALLVEAGVLEVRPRANASGKALISEYVVISPPEDVANEASPAAALADRDRTSNAQPSRHRRGKGAHWPRAWRRLARRKSEYGSIDYHAVIERNGLSCGICGEAVLPSDVHFDHIIPLSKGGAHAAWNVQVTHSWCNLHKSARLEEGQLGFLL